MTAIDRLRRLCEDYSEKHRDCLLATCGVARECKSTLQDYLPLLLDLVEIADRKSKADREGEWMHNWDDYDTARAALERAE